MYEQKRYSEAEAFSKEAIEHNRTDADAHCLLGLAIRQQGRPTAEATPHFQEALKLDPSHQRASIELSPALKAVDTAQRAINVTAALGKLAINTAKIIARKR